MADDLAARLKRIASRQTVLLTHYGRKTQKPYEVTIWFMVEGERVFLPTANVKRSWVRNVRKTARVKLKIGDETFNGEARFLESPDDKAHVLGLVRAKYWWAAPLVTIGQALSSLGLTTDTTGAFEVRIA